MKLRLSLIFCMTIAVLFAMSSCTKSYTCHCNFAYSGSPGLPDSNFKEYNIVDSRKNAVSKCSAESKTYSNKDSYGVTINAVETCYLY